MDITIRPALAADQWAITRIVWAARINPRDLHWQRFLVADAAGQVVGIGQVRRHRDGSRELASVAVIRERQGQGIGAALVRAILARERGPLYLMCASRMEPYYRRFGFRRLAIGEMPPYFRSIARVAGVITIVAALARQRVRLVVMRWDGDLKRQM
jgi:predicted N-acetyltransferase YhbS